MYNSKQITVINFASGEKIKATSLQDHIGKNMTLYTATPDPDMRIDYADKYWVVVGSDSDLYKLKDVLKKRKCVRLKVKRVS